MSATQMPAADVDRPDCVGPGNEIGMGFYRWWQSVEAESWEQLESIGLADEALARWVADDEDSAADLLSDHLYQPSRLCSDPLAFAQDLQSVLRQHYRDDIDAACRRLTDWRAAA